MVEQRNQPGSRHAGLPRPDAWRKQEQKKNPGGEPGAAGLDHGPTPPAGSMTSVVWAIFPALRRAIAALATARAARRRLFSSMFAGTARSWRGLGKAVTPAVGPGPAPALDTARPPPPPSPVAGTPGSVAALPRAPTPPEGSGGAPGG